MGASVVTSRWTSQRSFDRLSTPIPIPPPPAKWTLYLLNIRHRLLRCERFSHPQGLQILNCGCPCSQSSYWARKGLFSPPIPLSIPDPGAKTDAGEILFEEFSCPCHSLFKSTRRILDCSTFKIRTTVADDADIRLKVTCNEV